MKKTLLFVFLLSSTGIFAQFFNTGEQTLLTNLSASISINANTGITTLTLNGPDNAWFAIGFGALNMSGGADVFRTDGTTITDARSTGRFLPTADASQDWVLVSNTTSGGVRTIVATRANNTGDTDDYVFSATEGSIPLIYAHGTSTTYAYHGGANRGFTTVGVLSNGKEEKLLDFTMFPNPSTDFVNIQLPNGLDAADVAIYDYRGRQIQTRKVTQSDNRLDVSNISNGVYIIRVLSDNKIGAQRFVKN